jgi:hypothetical protein
MNNIEEFSPKDTSRLLAAASEVHDGRGTIINGLVKRLIAQLETAQKERDDLLNQEFQQRLANAEHQLYMKDLAIHNIKASRKAQFRKRLVAEAALSAANEKLSKPVSIWKLNNFRDAPAGGIEWAKGHVVANNKAVKAIRDAGFFVDGEHAPVKYIVILQSAWCNDSGSGISYDSDLVEFDKRDTAIKWGFRLRDSDDFNIGVLTNGALTSFDWMTKPLTATAAELAQIAENIGLAGFTVEGE